MEERYPRVQILWFMDSDDSLATLHANMYKIYREREKKINQEY